MAYSLRGLLASLWSDLLSFYNGLQWTSFIAIVLLASFASLLVWRLWRFTISPMLHPNDAKELPYWIPCR